MSWRLSSFDNDPFFSRDMPSISMGFPSFPMLGFSDHRNQDNHSHSRSNNRQLSLMDPFSMFNRMDRMMNETMQNPGGGVHGGHTFSSSSVMHYSSSGDGGEPTMYQATSSVRHGPGGVKETRKSECSSKTGVKKMAIGHHIGDRSHTIEKRQNMRSKEMEEHQDFINMDETDAASFDQEWKQRTRSVYQPSMLSDDHHPAYQRRGLPSISRGRDHRSRSPEQKKQRSRHAADFNSNDFTTADHSEAARRKEYLKREKKKVQF